MAGITVGVVLGVLYEKTKDGKACSFKLPPVDLTKINIKDLEYDMSTDES